LRIRIFIAALVLFFSITIQANCSFNQAEYIKDLLNPASIKNINIEIPKSSKFNRNFAKIITTPSQNIPPKLKKKFFAILKVQYKFGECIHEAEVRQNGDWKDHIDFADGMPLRSLNVKLKSGNILNSVRFKLLIPSTRNHFDEILGTIIAKEFGFIAPETFEVSTNINGVQSTMLFQESARKELLEKNYKREGPIFEGDEDLLWSFEERENFELENISLSRLVNEKWFLKGKSSQHITLEAFARLQKAYLDYANKYPYAFRSGLFPNQEQSSIFADYSFLMISMNGLHALRPHNRIFYFNSFTNYFEPIYYDGDLDILSELSAFEQSFIGYLFAEGYRFQYINKLLQKDVSENLLLSFKNRVIDFDEKLSNYFFTSLNQLTLNMESLQNQIDETNFPVPNKSFDDGILKYIQRVKNYDLNQSTIISIEKKGDHFFITDSQNNIEKISTRELSKVLSRNVINDKRYVLLSELNSDDQKMNDVQTIELEYPAGTLIASKNLHIAIDPITRTLTMSQSSSQDWALFKNAILKNWTLIFNGRKAPANSNMESQRFNKFGMTGCLNFFQSKFSNTIISSVNGNCEDSINFVNTTGNLSKVEVKDAFADAVDADFSDLEIDLIKINSAGNDCFDVSNGKYDVRSAILSDCSDKAISIGEASNFEGDEIYVKNSTIAIAVKDFSIASFNKITAISTPLCFELTRKKNEFGGAFASYFSIECDGVNYIDKDSKLLGPISEL